MSVLSLLRIGPHGKRMCNTFKLHKRGKFQCSFLQIKDIKKSRKLNRPSSKKPHYPQSNKNHYHNPDQIACLISKVNEAHILIDDVECLTLLDSEAQISTITIEFVKQLGLEIHQLDRILKFETIGGGDIPYMGYVEVNLKKS